MPQNSNFRLPRGHRFFPKNGIHGYDAKSQWRTPMVHLGASGYKKWVKTVKITMPQNSNFRLPRGHRFFPKNGSYGYGAKSRWGPHRVHLGASGVPLGPKNGSNRKKLPCPKIRIFDYLAVIDFWQKWKLRLWRQITVGTP